MMAGKYQLPERALVEKQKRLWSAWKLPEGYNVKLTRAGELCRIAGPGKREIYRTKDDAQAAATEKAKKQAEEVRAQVKEREARHVGFDTLATLRRDLRVACGAEDYETCAKLQDRIDELMGGGSAQQEDE